MKIIAVFWKRGCSRIMAASSKPSSSGMQTSTRMTATSFLSRYSSASRPEATDDEIFAEFLQDHLIGQQLGRLIVDQKDVYLFMVHHGVYRSAVQPHADGEKQLLGVDGFGQIVGGAGLQAFLAVALHRFRGQAQ